MTDACPIPTPAERAYADILDEVQEHLTRQVYAALEEATQRARSQIASAGLAMEPPAYEYLASVVHQQLYCTICGADPKTFAGGRVEAAIAVIRNSQNIARHYWGAKIEPYPRA